MGSEGGLGQSRQVIHVVEPWAVRLIKPSQQQVHMVRSLAREALVSEGVESNCDYYRDIMLLSRYEDIIV